MKELSIDQTMQARIDAAAGTSVDPSTIAAFECVAVSNAAIKKPGSLFNGATFAPGFMDEVAAYQATSGNAVPVQVMHNIDTLPTGKVFHSAVSPEGVRSQFYVPRTKSVVSDINNGLIGDVSVGMLSKHLFCSECNWDYRGPDSDFMNFVDQTCANGHVIGVDGVHLVQTGVDAWFELSLCGVGASPGAKIMSRSRASLMQNTANESFQRLAASGVAAEAVICVTPPTGDKSMPNELTARLEAQAVEIATLTGAKTTTEAALTAANTAKATAEAALTAAHTAKDTAVAELTSLKTSNAALSTEHDGLVAFVKDNAIKALVASGKKAEDVPAKLTDMLEVIKASGAHLAQLIGGSGKSNQSLTGAAVDLSLPASAFKTRS